MARRESRTEDCLVTSLKDKKTNRPKETKVLIGYVENLDAPEWTLYVTLTLDQGVRFRSRDVVHSVRLVTSTDPEADIGATIVWLKKDARLTHFGPREAKEAARFFEGDLQRYLARLPAHLALAGQTVKALRTTPTHTGHGCHV
jgi:hypothetical protein